MDSRSSVRSRGSEDPYGGVDETSPPRGIGRQKPSQDIRGGDRRNPSRDLTRSSYGADRRRLQRSRSPPRDGMSEAGSGASGAVASATRDEVVPVKSTIAEEEVALPPFARRDSIADEDEPASPERRQDQDNDDDHRSVYEEEFEEDVLSPRTPLGLGLNAISQRFGSEPQERSPDERRRPSVDANLRGQESSSGPREAILQAKIEGLERKVDGAEAERVVAATQADERIHQVEAELKALRQVRSPVRSSSFVYQNSFVSAARRRAKRYYTHPPSRTARSADCQGAGPTRSERGARGGRFAQGTMRCA